MPSQCPVCAKTNPADAHYCYYDGRPLSRDRQQEPLHVGNLPFPTPFYFVDGQACANFNQLALTCDDRWEEARKLLAEGIWATFFVGIGRLDLAAAAKQAAAEPDADRGLSQFLERLPADPDCLRPPTVALESREENLGQLTPGTDRSFELVVVNQGMLLLRGTITSQCDWLVLGERTGPSQKLFQTRTFYTVPVWVLGGKLRAGRVPLQGEIAIETNGGTVTLPVRAEVPIRPFPKGVYANDVLAGAKSPREIALKAKEHPAEAAVLFEQAAVKAWYASNGWSYPVEGTHGSGKGAVQQFFEALGLTRPPRLEISPTSMTIKAKAGERVAKTLTIKTEESKPVYAEASCNQDWLQAAPVRYRGNMVTIPLLLTIPPRPGETVHAQVTVEGNGRQRFVVPVSVAVAPGPRSVSAASMDNAWILRWAGWFLAGFASAGFLLVVAALLFLIAWNLLK